MLEIIDVVSSHISSALAAAGYPRLRQALDGRPGAILVGETIEFDEFMPPRVIFRPLSGNFGPPDMSMGALRKADDASDPERRKAIQNRAVASDEHTFEVRCCSVAPDGTFDPNRRPDAGRIDYEYTRALYHQVIASFQAQAPGAFKIAGGQWEVYRHVTRPMREFVFRMTILTPVLQELEPTNMAPRVDGQPAVAGYPFAPSDVGPSISDTMILNPGAGGLPTGGIGSMASGDGRSPFRDPGGEAAGVDVGTDVRGPGCENE